MNSIHFVIETHSAEGILSDIISGQYTHLVCIFFPFFYSEFSLMLSQQKHKANGNCNQNIRLNISIKNMRRRSNRRFYGSSNNNMKTKRDFSSSLQVEANGF